MQQFSVPIWCKHGLDSQCTSGRRTIWAALVSQPPIVPKMITSTAEQQWSNIQLIMAVFWSIVNTCPSNWRFPKLYFWKCSKTCQDLYAFALKMGGRLPKCPATLLTMWNNHWTGHVGIGFAHVELLSETFETSDPCENMVWTYIW